MSPSARLLLSDRDYEGALLTRLLYYGGVPALLEMADSRQMWDGEGAGRVRSRCFTRAEMIGAVQQEGLQVVEAHGISMFSLLVSFLSKLDSARMPDGASLVSSTTSCACLGAPAPPDVATYLSSRTTSRGKSKRRNRNEHATRVGDHAHV